MRAGHSLFKLQLEAAFSLIEIVLALGIISFALVGILGLFPVAIDAATNSQRETQAALIARSIFGDLKSQTGAIRYLVVGPIQNWTFSGEDSRTRIAVNLGQNKSHYLAYDNQNARPLTDSSDSESSYTNGRSDAGYMAKISVSDTIADPTTTLPADMVQVQVTVSCPAVAKESARKSYVFASWFQKK